ncbi:translation initiation factor IF-2 [Anaeromyxobacter dehalogenans]|uniref:Translation initiation factor IF-2 n=1 Tax=Anaeromyxobacter dehalogenans (strain 2CP-C) TaxID=290397 RepID=IF2_ANADE|nr:translation initiation factor IF-2 [Anaeromyxobacter dehalogenans]Q2IPZ7.1 RecName: Full=Translation initiation factor IF-2 [Anaeromyxobacter dehalogenans 2CP-C]ABC80877.1 bacterial translation initiation factor 2 (bIF-2) [Anaeromyxobacter dehalogenans 2CP-C]
MSKKRVHELGKQLKEQGIELSNQELVEKLHALGYLEVKSHSSSLEDDQAHAAYEKILAERKPKPAPARPSGPGFVVRKRAHVEPPTVTAPAAPPSPEPEYAEPQYAEPQAEQAYEPEPQAAQPEAGAEPAAAPEPPAEAAPLAAQAAPSPGAEAAAPAAPQAQPAQPAAPAAPPAPTAQPSAPPPAAAQPRPPQPSAPSRPPPPGYRPAPPPGARPPVSAAPGAPGQPGAAGQPPRPPVDPRTLRPTSTQAVVISRPLVPVRRVTPPTSARQQFPVAPGPRALGEVRELKVVPGSLGREREFIDVSRDKRRGRQPGRPISEEQAKSLSGKELLQAAISDRAYIPIRGKKKKPTKKGAKTQITEKAEHKKVIRIEESISVSELSQVMGVKASDLIRKLMQMGKMVTINAQIDADTAATLALEHGYTVEKKGFEVEEFIPEVEVDESKLVIRPPVVTVMGHVDHGKTSLLDAIRQADVAAGEAGGITQHIGAYSVNTPQGPITFLDTPGHEAFTAMRQRGAQVTDLVVLVVAADDGVMPQTVESIKAAKAAGVTILVAINKVDKPQAAPERVMQQLTEYELVAEQWGGTTIMLPVSARTKQGIPELLEYIALQSEVLELKANPDKLAAGRVIEAKLEKGRGPVATVLVEEGTLRVGDALVTGVHFGRVRAMMNERGEQVDNVGPGYPVEVLGLSGVPVAGDEFDVVEDEKAAKEVAQHRATKQRQKELGGVKKATLEDLFAKAKTSAQKVLNLVVKADVQGSSEAVSQALEKAATKKVGVKILESAVGAITKSDVLTAAAGNAVIVGFNTKPETEIENIASQQGVKILMFGIIYEAVDRIREEMAGLLEPIIKEKPLGKAEVRQVFNIPRVGQIAGSAVTEGVVKRAGHVRVVRDRKVVFTGKIGSLKRVKDDVREVAQGFECGIGVDGFSDVKQGDVLEVYELEEIRQSLD